ncbi:unnamed protein product [Effrenium voratum]|nr:unnamed protein product [Effrenium voratum]
MVRGLGLTLSFAVLVSPTLAGNASTAGAGNASTAGNASLMGKGNGKRKGQLKALALDAAGEIHELQVEKEQLRQALLEATTGANLAASAASAAAAAAEKAAARMVRKAGDDLVASAPAPGRLVPAEQGLHPVGLVIMADELFQKRYAPQIQSVRCYVQQQGYDLWLLNGMMFPRCVAFHSDFFYLKHCAVAEFLETQKEGYSAVVLDADVVAVALDRPLDFWLSSKSDLQFYERIAGPEVMAGNYIARNVPWVREFLRHWALLRSRKPPGFSSADNGALHVMLINALELDGAAQVTELYTNLTATVNDLAPYWSFVRAAQKVLGPPRTWSLTSTAFGRRHGCLWRSCELAVWPRMSFFVDDGVYLEQKASGLVGPIMHHGIKDAKTVEPHYFQSVWSCMINAPEALVDASSMGQVAWRVAVGYPELYPQGSGCIGPQCAEACVSNFTCSPLGDFDEPLMRQWQRDYKYFLVVLRRVLCFALASVVVLGATCALVRLEPCNERKLQPEGDEGDGQTAPSVVSLKTCDFLQINGQEVGCVQAEWSGRVLKRKKQEVGVLCEAPIHFEAQNAAGASTWKAAEGKIVVAQRGDEEFDAMARRAETSGAVGLVVVDSHETFEDDFEMAAEDPRRPPPVPAVLVPKSWQPMLRSGEAATMVRRYQRTPSKADARMLQFLRLRGVDVSLKVQ